MRPARETAGDAVSELLERLYQEYWWACLARVAKNDAPGRAYWLRYRKGTAAMIADLIERGVA